MAQGPYLVFKCPEKRETTFFYPITINEEKFMPQGQRTKTMDGRVKSVCALPAALLFKFMLINVGQ